MRELSQNSEDLYCAIDRLQSFQDGDRGLLDVTAFGMLAIPPLRKIVFKREPGGLYQARCRAVEALKRVGAYDVLIEFLVNQREIEDPVERLGEDAVINAVARSLAHVRKERVFRLLLGLGRCSHLTGVISALGEFRRPESIPVLINALVDDGSRRTAESALGSFGSVAVPALIKVANRHSAIEMESESSLRSRLSALRVLVEIGISSDIWPEVCGLMKEEDARIALAACKLCLACAPQSEQGDAIQCLVNLLPRVGWVLRAEIERRLTANVDIAVHAVSNFIEQYLSEPNGTLSESEVAILLSIREHGRE